MSKWVYNFGSYGTEGKASMKELLGGKGANLAEMCSLGLPVPPGFTITTEVCNWYFEHEKKYPEDLKSQVMNSLRVVEEALGRKFGSGEKPLLLSIRSGARSSMPGMMDTVLNLGLNDRTVDGMVNETRDDRFVYDSYRRFIQMYGNVVLGIENEIFESLLEDYKGDRGFSLDADLTGEDWKVLIPIFKNRVKEEFGASFPEDPEAQLWGAIGSVFGSWMNSRAKTYRRIHGISEKLGTAVNVQAMVFGNMGKDCATGVCFSRNPSTGENKFFGEFLVNAQGEDVVAGIRTPQPLTIAEKKASGINSASMEECFPGLFSELCKIREHLETHYKDMQDMEFTIERGHLWMLQTRNGKRTIKAALQIASDMVKEGLINKEDALIRINPGQLDQLLHPMLEPNTPTDVIGHGLPASPGGATGRIVFSARDAEEWAANGEKIILVRTETSPEDIGGMHAAEGILTTRGGMTSHAAVVARGMGLPCVTGATDLRIDLINKTLVAGSHKFSEGDTLTIDGTAGNIMAGAVNMILPEITGDFQTIMGWADEIRTMGVRANAETPEEAETAKNFGADGIGLSRTEHMFFDPGRINHMREMILAPDQKLRRAALEKLLPYQRDDFIQLFRIMDGLPVTVRLLDPPLNEFLPRTEDEILKVAEVAESDLKAIKVRKQELEESNPMLGHRGCRLAITYPEVYEMQARAIFEATAAVAKEGLEIVPEVMIPLVGIKLELSVLSDLVTQVAEAVSTELEVDFKYMIGTMVELPRACLIADEIAEVADFFSFGTNDLTQTTFGFSRDDINSFLEIYLKKGIISEDPFVTLDKKGVGKLIKLGVEKGRNVKPSLKIGICGEHGGDPESINFCQELGLTYVSCSPFRVPIARLAAAQAAIQEKRKTA